jgi:hypothetical protein
MSEDVKYSSAFPRSEVLFDLIRDSSCFLVIARSAVVDDALSRVLCSSCSSRGFVAFLLSNSETNTVQLHFCPRHNYISTTIL